MAKHFVATLRQRRSERASGIEPPSRPWQGRVIATIPRPQRYLFYSFLLNKSMVRNGSIACNHPGEISSYEYV